MNRQKRILAINDISCFGKCSLAVAVPILSAAGLETCMHGMQLSHDYGI